MACYYKAIWNENEVRYGTEIGRIGQMLLADRYAKRTHFIFELLQNAEDALARRKKCQGSRAVSFELEETSLRVSHYGDPFNESDVRGICGIDESTKEFNEIGRFGIGFKSVYAFTDRPKIHSGSEDFAIEEYVRPIAVSKIDRHADETVIQIPFKNPADNSARDEIVDELKQIGGSALLFLREISEIIWRVEDGASGHYLRESVLEEEKVDLCVRRVAIIGEQEGQRETDEEWLIFSSPALPNNGSQAKPVEIAFSCLQGEVSNSPRIRRVKKSPLVVFFPTDIETHLGFLVQGPYRTTPSRDNIARDDEWNKRLVEQTAALLRKALCWLRDKDWLDTDALRCLPLDSSKFGDDSMFAPIFEGAKRALLSEPLLPRSDSGYVEAARARLGGAQALRELFSPTQIATLYEEEQELAWPSDDITRERTRELYDYFKEELNVVEVDTQAIIRRLNKEFLENQSDDWIQKLYEFLNERPALQRGSWSQRRRAEWFDRLPLIRLQDGKHVPAKADDRFLAFLPSETATNFPTVRKSVCTTEPAREFLQSLGLKEPDPVDDVIAHVLPRYGQDEISIDDAEYKAEIGRILSAFDTDSKTQREKLIDALKKVRFVMAVDAGDGSKYRAKPGAVYLATDRLKDLFKGVKGVLLVDDSYECLRSDGIKRLLEACETPRNLCPIEIDGTNRFNREELSEIRQKAGWARSTGGDEIKDRKLHGLDELLTQFPTLEAEIREKKAALLWNSLSDLAKQSLSVFAGTYSWYYGRGPKHSAEFDAVFVVKLNETAWIPGADGELHRPEFVSFDLGWDKNPFLELKIRFKSPDIEILAQEVGIDSGILELIKERGLSERDLRAFLDKRDESGESESTDSGETGEMVPSQNGDSVTELGLEASVGQGDAIDRESHGGGGDNKASTDSASTREFISYLQIHPDQEEPDPDNLDHEKRMNLEAEAIERILTHERDWRRTEKNNPGYDLYKVDSSGRQSCWCEVKAMKKSLQNRPVGISHTQFGGAIEHGESFWLYVVEYADDDEKYRIVKIQDPFGKARTFTFDHGWLEVADVIGAGVVEKKS